MNAIDVMKYGHLSLMNTVDGLPESEWEKAGVCGVWSVKDIISHLASYEQLLNEILNTFLGSEPGPTMLKWSDAPEGFNDAEVAARLEKSASAVLAEYGEIRVKNMASLANIPAEKIREAGTMPWYGNEYALDDYLVYSFYGHKREHCAQIAVFRDQINL